MFRSSVVSTGPVRVLQYSYGGEFVSGIDTFLTEVYRCIDRTEVQFDFLFRYGSPLGASEDAIAALGARVWALDIDERAHPLRRQLHEVIRLWSFFRVNRYDVVEINMTALFMILTCATVARLRGARVVIAHAHDSVKSERTTKRLLKRIFAPALDSVCTEFWACSRDAAQYLFPPSRMARGSWRLVKNGIDASKFGFDKGARVAFREELGIQESLCVGMVGRFTEQKNHEFALKIWSEVVKLAPDSRLILVGNGPLMSQSVSQADSLGLSPTVRFMGARSDVSAIMSGLDVMLAPSHHEGFPLISLEAQCADLPMLVSDAFPSECDVTGNVAFMSLDRAPRDWALELLKLDSRSTRARRTRSDDIRASGYTREATARQLMTLYPSFGRQGDSRG